jgi:hypothetical protein
LRHFFRILGVGRIVYQPWKHSMELDRVMEYSNKLLTFVVVVVIRCGRFPSPPPQPPPPYLHHTSPWSYYIIPLKTLPPTFTAVWYV